MPLGPRTSASYGLRYASTGALETRAIEGVSAAALTVEPKWCIRRFRAATGPYPWNAMLEVARWEIAARLPNQRSRTSRLASKARGNAVDSDFRDARSAESWDDEERRRARAPSER